ncbi:MAG: DUF3429 domain-containing protein [Gammaproteobacteria bacterium]
MKALGYGGLIPFIGGSVGMVMGWQTRPTMELALTAYGAVILSFMSAIWWGLGLTDGGLRDRLALWAVIPALLAWLSVLWGGALGLIGQALLFAVLLVVDKALARETELTLAYTPGYMIMRRNLTVAACLCLTIAGVNLSLG